ncbi:MAG TPA: hypothetical protein VGL51_17735 [Solirubrobacteraceae bacterium]|jgi:membrane protein YdbS with pleckstrin-like domain
MRMASAFAPALILFAPSVASLAIAYRQAERNLLPLWWGGVFAIVVFVGIAFQLFAVPALHRSRQRRQLRAGGGGERPGKSAGPATG